MRQLRESELLAFVSFFGNDLTVSFPGNTVKMGYLSALFYLKKCVYFQVDDTDDQQGEDELEDDRNHGVTKNYK